MESRVRAAAPASTAFYGRLIPQTTDEEQVAAALAALEAPGDSVTRHRAVSSARTLRNAVLSESRFYRVLHESKLYSIDFGGLDGTSTTENAAENGEKDAELDDMRRRAPSLAESDYKVVRIQELAKPTNGRTASARNRQQMQQQDRNGP